jgi:hypothetical protein
MESAQRISQTTTLMVGRHVHHGDDGVLYDRILLHPALLRSAALTTAGLWAGQGSLRRQSQTAPSVCMVFADEFLDFEPAWR